MPESAIAEPPKWMIEINKEVEYEQICQDWRHRDQMLWQSLAGIAGTVVGLQFVFSKDFADNADRWLFATIVSLMVLMFNVTLLVKIVKDNYYQWGSGELLKKFMCPQLSELLIIDNNVKKEALEIFNARIHEPSKNFFEEMKKSKRIPSPHWLYKKLTGLSTFKTFFYVLLILVLLSFAFFAVCLYKVISVLVSCA